MSRLSEDIIVWEILTLLPVKSLFRFQCICKSWRCLLSNPNQKFINLHLKRTSQNPEYESLIMGIEKRDPFAVDQYIDILSRSKLAYNRIHNSPRHEKLLFGSVNGLVCLKQGHLILLWNPATSLAKTIIPPKSYQICLGPRAYGFFGFGWNCVDNDYKVVVCADEEGCKKGLQGVVYSSNLDSWSQLLITHPFPPYIIRGYPKTIVKGCPYWTNRHLVTKFDVESNRFKFFFFPDTIRYTLHCRTLANSRDSLVLMAYTKLLISVHHLDEECSVWSKTYTIGPIIYDLGGFSLCFKYGNELLFNRGKMLYDPETNGVKVIGGGGYWCVLNGFSYTGSLVFLQGMETLHTQSHWRYPEVKQLELPRLELRSPKCSWRLFASRLLHCFLCWS